jgi:hypothetical protein
VTAFRTPADRFVSRAAWRAQPLRHNHEGRRDGITSITVHHSTGATFGPPAEEIVWVRAIQREHQDVRGYADIAYNALVSASGRIYEGRDNRIVGAHALSNANLANRTSLGVCFLGNGDELTADAKAAFRVYVYVASAFAHRGLPRLGHRDWSHNGGIATYCPSNALEAFFAKLS